MVMFNLEKTIANWREQMLAAGIKSPAPLDELENHLREEIARQMKAGLNEQKAFEKAAVQIGQTSTLEKEFAKNICFRWKNADNEITKTTQILGVLWFVQSTWLLIRSATSPVAVAIILYFPYYWQSFTVFLTLFALAGVIGSVFLFLGAKFGMNVVRILAVLELLVCVIENITSDHSFGNFNHGFGIFSILSLITIWLLRPAKYKALKPAAQ